MLSRRQLLLGAASVPALAQKRSSVERPNIVVLVADSLPAWMLGCYGNKEIRTPHIDRLAQAGVRFASHFAASPLAAPNRASLLSGRTPLQHGVDAQAPAAFAKEVLAAAPLAAAGYHCGFTGLWGFGNETQAQAQFSWWQPAASDQVAQKAAGFVSQQRAGEPFLLVACWPRASEPPAKKYLDIYAQAKLDSVNYEPIASNAAANKEMFRATLANIRRAAAALTAFDEQVAVVIESLRARGVLDQTVVVLTSAAGALLGRHGLWGDGTASEPINMYEETVALPLLWRWPERIPPGTVRTEIVSACDLLPSLCETAGVTPPERNLSGRSYFNLALSRPLPRKNPWKTQVFAALRNTLMVREHRFKLVLRNNGAGPNEFFDLSGDPRERVNQYANPQYVTVRDRLAADLARWRKQYV